MSKKINPAGGRGAKDALTRKGITKMCKQPDIAFPPSGNWLTFADVPLNHQPPDLLMQLLEYFFVHNGVKVDAEADIRPAEVLLAQLLARLDEIKSRGGGLEGEGPPNSR